MEVDVSNNSLTQSLISLAHQDTEYNLLLYFAVYHVQYFFAVVHTALLSIIAGG